MLVPISLFWGLAGKDTTFGVPGLGLGFWLGLTLLGGLAGKDTTFGVPGLGLSFWLGLTLLGGLTREDTAFGVPGLSFTLLGGLTWENTALRVPCLRLRKSFALAGLTAELAFRVRKGSTIDSATDDCGDDSGGKLHRDYVEGRSKEW